jgi:hypothetical protein
MLAQLAFPYSNFYAAIFAVASPVNWVVPGLPANERIKVK